MSETDLCPNCKVSYEYFCKEQQFYCEHCLQPTGYFRVRRDTLREAIDYGMYLLALAGTSAKGTDPLYWDHQRSDWVKAASGEYESGDSPENEKLLALQEFMHPKQKGPGD